MLFPSALSSVLRVMVLFRWLLVQIPTQVRQMNIEPIRKNPEERLAKMREVTREKLLLWMPGDGGI